MKVKVSETNMPKWGNVTVKFDVPEKLEALQEMSKNIFWTWTSEATNLFKDIDAELWRATAGNPVLMLQKLSYERLEEIAADKAMMTRINAVYKNFRKYMDEPRRTDMPSVAYFSMEYGLSNVLKIYSGGLGVLAGDYLKEASDCNINMTGVGFLYRYGYFKQTLSMDGQQLANYEAQNFNQLSSPLRVANYTALAVCLCSSVGRAGD